MRRRSGDGDESERMLMALIIVGSLLVLVIGFYQVVQGMFSAMIMGICLSIS